MAHLVEIAVLSRSFRCLAVYIHLHQVEHSNTFVGTDFDRIGHVRVGSFHARLVQQREYARFTLKSRNTFGIVAERFRQKLMATLRPSLVSVA
jgi:hypothetical protein